MKQEIIKAESAKLDVEFFFLVGVVTAASFLIFIAAMFLGLVPRG